MFVIGLTGGIGTGKTLVSQMLEELGAVVVNADLLGHEIYLPQTDGWREVVDTFGDEVLASDGQIDRQKLGSIVFNDPAELEKLNAIAHPRIYSLAEQRLEEVRAKGTEVAVLEAALLIEAKWLPLVDDVWVTTSDEAHVIQRLQERNNMTKEAVRSRIGSQMPQSERVGYANATIENSASLEHLRDQVAKLWESRVLTHKENRLKT